MLLSDFNYELPAELVARYPADERRGSKLLVLDDAPRDHQFGEFAQFLRANDLLVFNDTRVIPARLQGRKQTGGRIEILIERRLSDHEALALLRASKTPQAGAIIKLADECEALVMERRMDLFLLRFSAPLEAYLQRHGSVPLPPYLEREADASDAERYQTVYARWPGAVAAPTAGLHFDAQMLNDVTARGANTAFVTLHVGAGTFQSLREKQVAKNRLHAERVHVTQTVCDAVHTTRAIGGRVIAVGTTSVRALETASASGKLEPYDGDTELFIYPGYEFRSVDAMLTNFHLPQSSLLMLVAAFAGTERTLAAYRHAVQERYRFFSYGDAMLVWPRRQ